MEAKSSIIAIGLTVHNTPVEIREKLSIPEVRACAPVSLRRVPTHRDCACVLGLTKPWNT